MTGDHQMAEDLTQDACLRAYQAFGSFRKDSNFKAWIFRIMANQWTDQMRRQARNPCVDGGSKEADFALAVHCSKNDQPDVQLLYKTFRSDAFRAMMQLPPDIRLVVSLALLEEFSYQEIAELVNCPVGTVRSRLSRGREQLQRELKDYMPDRNDAKTLHGSPAAKVKTVV